jgi:hypothetical protein
LRIRAWLCISQSLPLPLWDLPSCRKHVHWYFLGHKVSLVVQDLPC